MYQLKRLPVLLFIKNFKIGFDEDKNGQREIWLWTDKKFGTGCKETVLPYIQDLIETGYIKLN